MNRIIQFARATIVGCGLIAGAVSAFGFYYDSVYSYSYYTPGWGSRSDGYVYSSGSVSAPSGAEVNWSVYAYAWGSSSASASLQFSGTGVTPVSTSVSGWDSDGGYQFTSSAANISYSMSANTSHFYSDANAEAGAEFVVAW